MTVSANAAAAAGGGFLEALRRGVTERVAKMPDERATVWIAGHGLLSMAIWAPLPAEVRERLRERARRTTAYNLLAIARFQEAIAALDGIPVCPLKGIYLLDTVYRDDPGSRPLGDVDLLVPGDRVDEAVTRLERALDLAELPSSRRLRRVYPERVLAGRGVALEVHGRLGYKHGWASAWADLVPVPGEVHSRRVHVLDRETTLVHLVAHLVKHRPFSRLVWVEDVLRWAEGGVDVARAVEIARRIGARRSFIAGVRALRWLVGQGFLPDVPASSGGLGQGLLLANERALWSDLRRRPLPDPAATAEGADRPTGLGAALSSLLLADRPGHALRIVAVKGTELLLRRRPRRALTEP